MNFLEKPIYNLLQKEPFFANFFLGSQILFDNKDVERAAVRIYNNDVQFMFNTEFMKSLTIEQQMEIIKHETLHVVFEHIYSYRYGSYVNKDAKNVAMDCAINQFLKNLPGECITLEFVEKICNKKLTPKESWEYYYEQMKEALKDSGKSNDHDHMEASGTDADGNPIDGATNEAVNRAIIRDKVNKAVKTSAGNIPEGLESIISAMNQGPKVNWKQQLRNLVASSRCVQTKSSRMKTHRRFELEQPGKKKKRKLVLGVCADSSGSVSDESYSIFLNEIKSIAKSTTKTYLIHADCVVQKIDTIKEGKAKGDVLKKRHGCGGTAYSPAIEKCMQLGCDAIIYFGDADASDVPKNPGVPFIWVIVGSQEPPGNFGRVIRI